ncbi:hypothetical protein NLY43_04385 [Mesorhizobium sp. C416B]|uniref:hypothetical protein n=1 Tax=unclassified Mesorhizobium TaxID=325217 RepID=UPI0003CEFB06|nr:MULTISPECIES: hypothetical protein [unclassified Mesorhizobium]ESX47744.1 hypothetical protein X762_18005 [Mesorhizobium sp. LSHC426A00]ESX47967.1 hypothetical protein X761_29090 [Mesorhizobium sp. LSHC424B00]ESX69936.1 hypothetical protein X758_19125 [Mesorhizobium sp. LSHC416B00]ESX71836.1 hypothetical protein X757_22280 [Mesorhizobium sp. LSHC414A00]WJI64011.1 hypothetical protein NLY43_04385 [Mesorhizobium sp. C416B]
MRALTKLSSSNSDQLDTIIALAKVFAKADSNVTTVLSEDGLLADIADVVSALVARETKTLSNRLTLLEIAAGSQDSLKPGGAKRRTAKVKL